MKKRFIRQDFFADPFVRKLEPEMKLMWVYFLTHCDYAGIFVAELDVAGCRLGFEVDEDKVLKVFRDKLVQVLASADEKYYFFPDYISLQYSDKLSLKNKVHKAVIDRLSAFNLIEPTNDPDEFILKNNDPSMGHRCPIDGTIGYIYNIKDKDKEKEKVKEKKQVEAVQMSIDVWPTFQDFWNAYDKKVGDLQKIRKKWDGLSQADRELIMQYIPMYVEAQPDKQYRKNPETFLNNKSWNDEIIGKNVEQQSDRANQWLQERIANIERQVSV